MRKPSLDLQRFAERVFGEPAEEVSGEPLERLTAALEALRAAFVPLPRHMRRYGRPGFLESLERFAEAAGPLPPIAAPHVDGKPHGDISHEAPRLLLNPRFWLVFEKLRAAALAGDEESFRLLGSVLERLEVSKRRFEAGRAERATKRAAAVRSGIWGTGGPLERLAVDIVRGKRGPVPLRARELFLAAPAELRELRRLESESEQTRDPKRRDELQRESAALREKLRRFALTLEYRRDEAARAERERKKTRRGK